MNIAMGIKKKKNAKRKPGYLSARIGSNTNMGIRSALNPSNTTANELIARMMINI
jgi:hypothetical protein